MRCHIGGGLHHAFPNHGEGFCPFNDVAVAVRVLQSARRRARRHRRSRRPPRQRHRVHLRIAIRACSRSRCISSTTTRCGSRAARSTSGCPTASHDATYLRELERALPAGDGASTATASSIWRARIRYEDDQLGGLRLTQEGLRQRDRLVIDTVRAARRSAGRSRWRAATRATSRTRSRFTCATDRRSLTTPRLESNLELALRSASARTRSSDRRSRRASTIACASAIVTTCVIDVLVLVRLVRRIRRAAAAVRRRGRRSAPRRRSPAPGTARAAARAVAAPGRSPPRIPARAASSALSPGVDAARRQLPRARDRAARDTAGSGRRGRRRRIGISTTDGAMADDLDVDARGRSETCRVSTSTENTRPLKTIAIEVSVSARRVVSRSSSSTRCRSSGSSLVELHPPAVGRMREHQPRGVQERPLEMRHRAQVAGHAPVDAAVERVADDRDGRSR